MASNAKNFTERIQELEQERRKNLRQAGRARKRRREALAKGQWEAARDARKTATRNNKQAQQNLKDIRTLRSARKKANFLARTLRHRRSAGKAADGGQLYWFDGKPVRAEIYPHLVWARKNGWRGHVTSGYRSPTYSKALCRAMCGRDSCSGRCAGTGSNHVRIAVDVTDYTTFERLMRYCPHRPRIFNALDWRDPVHFSPNGR